MTITESINSRLLWATKAAAHHTTMWIGARYGHHFPMHFVIGYPRSGTTWFSEMLGDYLRLPRPSHYLLPIAFPAVIHTHALAKGKVNDCFYVVRDGRDAIVSTYFYMIELQKKGVPIAHISTLLDSYNDLDDIQMNLPSFIKAIFLKPQGVKENWGDHTINWAKKAEIHPAIVPVRFEDLLVDTAVTFRSVLYKKYGTVDEIEANDVAKRHQFKRQVKRDKSSHRTPMRKGKSGDWQLYFSRHSCQLFDYYAGDSLLAFGYEPDRSWVALPKNGS